MNKDWKDTDLYKFTSEHQDADVEVWGGFGRDANDGFIPFGWIVGSTDMDYEYFFNIKNKRGIIRMEFVWNCDNCKYYQWYYDWCDKWNCEVDGREVHSCYEQRRENDKR